MRAREPLGEGVEEGSLAVDHLLWVRVRVRLRVRVRVRVRDRVRVWVRVSAGS